MISDTVDDFAIPIAVCDRQMARDILECGFLEGASLEDEGGYGTAVSHWDRRYFMGELMIGTSSASTRVAISNLTLALAEDSGW